MAGTGDMEKVKEEQLPPPPSNGADLAEDESNCDKDTAEVHHNEEAGLEVQPSDENDMIKRADSILQPKDSEYELVGTASLPPIETKECMVKGAWVMETAQSEEERERESGSSCVRETKRIVLEYVDSGEEEIELDLDNFQTHAPHCPNCHHRITKLILRRKIPALAPAPAPAPHYIFGYCIICFVLVRTTVSRFVVSIWRKLDVIIRPINQPVDPTPPILDPVDEKKKPRPPPSTKVDEDEQSQPTIGPQNYDEKTTNGKHDDKDNESPTEVPNKPVVKPENRNEGEHKKEGEERPPAEIENEAKIDDNKEIEVGFSIRIGHVNLVEILKCIVYGGLIESITSSSVVASAAATDASTLNVFAIGLALLFSGLIAFGINLVELKNDVNTDKKYKEVVGGSKDKFVFHATLIILSYLVFGLVAPTTFALAFRESDDRDYKIVAVAAAAFACIFILALAKAHASQPKSDQLRCYVKTTRHYLILALFTSGLAYAVGYTIDMYVLKFGWFTSVQRVTCYDPEMVTTAPTYASY